MSHGTPITVSYDSALRVVDPAYVVERAATGETADEHERDEEDTRRHHHEGDCHHQAESCFIVITAPILYR